MGRQIKRMVAEGFSLPKEAVLSLPVFTVFGREEVLIENVRALLRYTNTSLRVRTGEGILCLEGENLTIGRWKQNAMVVLGQFQSLTWEEETR